MGKQIGYCRVSSIGQRDNTSLPEQTELILQKYPLAEIKSEVYSGAAERYIFNQVVEDMEEGDILVCTKLDRFCRTTKEGLEYIDILLEKGCSIHILNMGLIENSPIGRLIVTQLLAFAEFERAMILERTKSGRARARLDPEYKDGRKPKFTKAQIAHALQLLDSNSYKKVENMTGISVSTLVRAKRKKSEAKVLADEAAFKSFVKGLDGFTEDFMEEDGYVYLNQE